MAGILDSKSRILDTVITQEGKRQIAQGGLRAVYATVSDGSTYYEADAVSGSADASNRVYFESPTEDINDSITMETDDSGKLLGYPVQGGEFYSTDGLILGRSSISGTLTYATPANFTGFASLAEGIITSSLDRFKNLYTIGTRDADESDSLQMTLSKYSYNFTINNMFPFLEGPTDYTTNVDYIEPIFFDELLANVDNFQYLPPLTDPLSESERRLGRIPGRKKFGNYVKIQRPEGLTLQKIMNGMNIFPGEDGRGAIEGDPDADEDESRDYADAILELLGGDSGLEESQEDGSAINLTSDKLPKERVSVFFPTTSSTNNIMMQMFELDSNASKLTKLDVIDFGVVNDTNDLSHPRKHIFFVGKIFINSIGLPAFVALFVIIMD